MYTFTFPLACGCEVAFLGGVGGADRGEDSAVVPLYVAVSRPGGSLTPKPQEVVQTLKPAQPSACSAAFGTFILTPLRKLRSQQAQPPVVPARRRTRSRILELISSPPPQLFFFKLCPP